MAGQTELKADLLSLSPKEFYLKHISVLDKGTMQSEKF